MFTTSASVLRSARQAAQLTQAELAQRANITQSVVSAYEAGRREPALSTLLKLVGAAGYTLNLELESQPIHTPDFMKILHTHKKQILQWCADAGASNMRIFGSVARGTAGPTSDIDLLVDLAPETSLFTLMSLEEKIQKLVGIKVDLVPESGLKPAIKEEVLSEAIPLG